MINLYLFMLAVKQQIMGNDINNFDIKKFIIRDKIKEA